MQTESTATRTENTVLELKPINRRHTLRKRDNIRPHEAGAGENFEYCSLPGGTATAHARTLRGADLVEVHTIQNAHRLEAELDLSSDRSPEAQLRDALTKSSVRVIDVSGTPAWSSNPYLIPRRVLTALFSTDRVWLQTALQRLGHLGGWSGLALRVPPWHWQSRHVGYIRCPCAL
jgi:hypothetical protein